MKGKWSFFLIIVQFAFINVQKSVYVQSRNNHNPYKCVSVTP